jgi:UDP-N-acetylmuramoyl-tripeptide--D-alanyl-D-alanine ligase
MTAAVLRRRFSTLATKGNFNNHIGMPLTLLQLRPEHEWAVLELGMNHPGEIRTLGNICLPDIGIITNVAAAHIEGLGSIEGVARAKGELLQTIRTGGTAIINGEDPHVQQLVSRPFSKDHLQQVLRFGFGENMDIRADSLHDTGNGTRFTLQLPDEHIDVHLKLPGTFMVLNALAAAGAGYVCGVSTPDIRMGLEQFTGVPGRMHIIQTPCGIHIIDDTYNANPGSMQAAITTLTTLRQLHNGFLVVGDMYELGHESAKQHARIGQLAALQGVSGLFITGRFADEVAEGARNAGLSPERIFIGSKDAIVKQLICHLKTGDWLLIKGSRAMAMETMVQKLIHHYESHTL